jgi:signal recognition particle GTPase
MIARASGLFGSPLFNWDVQKGKLHTAGLSDHVKLAKWQDSLQRERTVTDAVQTLARGEGMQVDDEIVTLDTGTMDLSDDVLTTLTQAAAVEATHSAIDANDLLRDQRRAYDIVDWHLKETMDHRSPPQLLMLIIGEGGTGKSKTIKAITANLENHAEPLVKAAFTGVAASGIDGKTLHAIMMQSVRGG